MDSQAIRKFFTESAKWTENGVAQYNAVRREKLAKELTTVENKTVLHLVCHPNEDYTQAAGVDYLAVIAGTHRDGGTTIISQKRQQMQNQADLIYFSTHGSHDGISIGLAEGLRANWTFVALSDLKPADHWGEDLDVVIIAGCSLLDADVGTNPARTTTVEEVRALCRSWEKNPGKSLLNTGPKLFIGYRGPAPGDNAGANRIAEEFVKLLPNDIKPTDRQKLRKAFSDANLKSARAISSRHWRGYAALDLPTNKFFFFRNNDATKDFYQSLDLVEDSKDIP